MSVPESAEFNPLIVGREICRDFERASRMEWLETNHTGAYAMGTVAGVNTRRYHALLLCSLRPPADRVSVLPRVEETVTLDGQDFSLATAQYPGTVHPRGFELLDEFRIDPLPEWRYRCNSASIGKTVCLLDRQQSVLVRYHTTLPCTLKLRPLFSFRDYHSLGHRNDSFAHAVRSAPDRVVFAPYEHLPALSILHGGIFTAEGEWFLRNEYLRELERGLDFEEDLFSPGVIEFEMTAQRDAWFIATLQPQLLPAALDAAQVASLLAAEAKRRSFHSASQLDKTLCRALDQFRICRHDNRPSLIAGYPWFTDWSRDTLISLPALSVAGFPANETRAILEMLIHQRSEGLLPNRFLDTRSEPEYNTADATLWLFVAARAYIDETGDLSFLRDSLYPAVSDILAWHRGGARYGIHVDLEDRLLWTGEAGTQLTWMDARANGTPVTSRVGKPVEINALWYNALRIAADWSALLDLSEEVGKLTAEADETLVSFRNAFWNHKLGCLFDVVDETRSDASIRPNQLFALSLPYPLLEQPEARRVVDIVSEKLLTPVGLRTLEPANAAFRPRFEGSMAERDSAYHQGTVWPWLIGPFVAAYLYAFGETQQAVNFCRSLLDGIRSETTTYCLGSLPEVFDACPPHLPGGCPAQLWSVAQLILSLHRLYQLESRKLSP